MNSYQSLAFAAVLSVAAGAASAQSALTENTVKRITDEGKKCTTGLDAAILKPLLNPSSAVKAVLLVDAAKLRDSEEMKKLTEPERKLVADVISTSKACSNHLESFSALGKEIASKAAEIKADPKAMELYGKVAEAHKQVAAAIESATKATPEIAHFLHVHGTAP